jgi:AraC-like DNA-binding protein
MKLYIKNMVSIRCKMIVKEELSKLGLHYTIVELGEVEIIGNISAGQYEQIRAALLKFGLELLEDRKSVLIQKIKSVIIELVHYTEEPLPVKFSIFLSQKLKFSYTYLSNLFSETQGVSIERFYIVHKIERIKELLVYDELSLSEIAHRMNYSSAAHLCAQFKRMTGLTSSDFKHIKNNKRYMLEDLGMVKTNANASF